MDLTKIIQGVNAKLAGEMLNFDMIKVHLDSVIDDINSKLSSCFPSFTEFNSTAYPEQYPNYNFFPDKYIRSVVINGAAYKFFVTDEEGIMTAQQYSYDYRDNLFLMERDYMALVPEEFQVDNEASVVNTVTLTVPYNFRKW